MNWLRVRRYSARYGTAERDLRRRHLTRDLEPQRVVRALQDRWDRARRLIDARARDLADIPGGNTGLLVRDYKGRNADVAVYKADTALMAEMRAAERQAAEELGQWVPKSQPSHLNLNEMTERMNAGR